jgi:hypothetical protein
MSGIGGGLSQGGRAVVVHQALMCWCQFPLSAAVSTHVFAMPFIGSQAEITWFVGDLWPSSFSRILNPGHDQFLLHFLVVHSGNLPYPQ